MRTVTYYKFSELSEIEQKAYFEKNSDKFQPEYKWWDGTISDIEDALTLAGFSNVKIGFSGFCCQGDGAHFTGNYSYRKLCRKAIYENYPEYAELHNLVEELTKLERKDFYSIKFKITQSGNYSHEMATNFEFSDSRKYYGWVSDFFDENPYKEACREFMRSIYNTLEEEYYYISGWDYVKECPENYDYLEVSQAEKDKLI